MTATIVGEGLNTHAIPHELALEPGENRAVANVSPLNGQSLEIDLVWNRPNDPISARFRVAAHRGSRFRIAERVPDDPWPPL